MSYNNKVHGRLWPLYRELSPEPEEGKDFLIDNVEGENTEGIEALDGSWRTHSSEETLGNPRENSGHGVEARLGIRFQELDNSWPVVTKLMTQEPVRDVHSPEDDEEVGKFTGHICEAPETVVPLRAEDVPGHGPNLLVPLLTQQRWEMPSLFRFRPLGI